MRTIAVVNQKGGSGKTTIAIQLALGFWLRGQRTMIADLDPQRSTLLSLRRRRIEGPEAVPSTGAKLYTLQASAKANGYQMLIVDTAAVLETEAALALTHASLAVMVLRPTFLDLASAVNTARAIRQLQKPGVIVINQAPPARGNVEPPAVRRALDAAQLLRLPIAPVLIRARAHHQVALEQGSSTEELYAGSQAAREIGQFCDYINAATPTSTSDIGSTSAPRRLG